MPSWMNRLNIYTFLWVVYMLSEASGTKDSALRQVLLFVLLGISFYYFVKTNLQFAKPPYFKALNILMLMFFLYGTYLIVWFNPSDYVVNEPSYNYLKVICRSLLPIYAFFVLFKDNPISEKNMYMWIFTFIAVAVASYYMNERNLLIAAMLRNSTKVEFVNNIGYVFLSILPMCVFLHKKAYLQFLAIGCCFFFVILSMKRGAVFAALVCVVLFLWKKFSFSSLRKKILLFFVFFALAAVGYLFFEYEMNSSQLFQERLYETLDGKMSRRDDLVVTFVKYIWNETTPLQFLFGSGANATVKIYYNYAHCDWVEIAVNQGLFGIIIYLIYWIALGKYCLSKKYDPLLETVLQMLFVILFMKTIFSMSYSDMAIPSTFVLGYCLAQEKKNEQVVYCNSINQKKTR